MKIFSTKFHGVLDYLTVAVLPTLPRVLGWSPETTRFCDVAAGGVLLYSLGTRYERGAVDLIPMPCHFVFDATLGVLLLTVPRHIGEPDAMARAVLTGLGLFSLFASVATETEVGQPALL